MGLFSKKKSAVASGDHRVKILGSGCARCNRLEEATINALKELGLESDVDHVREYEDIMAYGVMSLPALVIDGKVVSAGKILSVQEAKEIITASL